MAFLEVVLAFLIAGASGYQIYLFLLRVMGMYENRRNQLKLGIRRARNFQASSTKPHAHSSALFMLLSTFFRSLAVLPMPPKSVRNVLKPARVFAQHYDLAVSSTDSIGVLFWQIVVVSSLMGIAAVWVGPCSLFLGFLLFAGPPLILRNEYKNQQKMMRLQLIGFVEELTDSLKANKSFAQALQMCATHVQLPLKSYVEKAIALIACGTSSDEAFSRGMEGAFVSEAQTLSAALQVQYRTGGNLMILLTEYASQFRQTLLFEQNLQTQTAQGRLSVKVVAVIPPVLIAIMSFISPGYLDCFFSSQVGRGLFVGSIFLDLCGLLLVHKMMSISEM